MNIQNRAHRIFDNTTNIPSSYLAPAISEQKHSGALTHISSASKAPTPPIETFFNPSNFIHRSAIDTAYEQKSSNVSRKFNIYPSGAKNTFVYEASVSSKSDFYDDDDSFFSAPDDASILARSSLETLQSVYGIGHDGFDSDASDHSPSRIVPPNLPTLIEAQKNYNTGVIAVALPEGVIVQCGRFYYPDFFIMQALCHQTLTLKVPSLTVRMLVKILPRGQPPCNGTTP